LPFQKAFRFKMRLISSQCLVVAFLTLQQLPGASSIRNRNKEFFRMSNGIAGGSIVPSSTNTSDKYLYAKGLTALVDEAYWSLDEMGRFHSKINDSMCIQAEHSPEGGEATPLLLLPCSDEEADLDLQMFEVNGTDDGSYSTPPQRLSLAKYRGYCVFYVGDWSGEESMQIVLKDSCDDEDSGWLIEYQVLWFVLEAKGGGCLSRKQDGSDDLFLAECSADDDYMLWRDDGEGRYQSYVGNSTKCIQAGRYPSTLHGIMILKKGANVYAKDCVSENSPRRRFQTFYTWQNEFNFTTFQWFSTIHISEGSMEPGRFCITPSVDEAVVGETSIIVAEWESLSGNRAIGWKRRDPCYSNYTPLGCKNE
jgi:hypothetical protein